MQELSNIPNSEIVLYTNPDNSIQLEVKLAADTVWLSTKQMASLFGKEESNIRRHIGNIFREKELSQKSNVQKMHVAFSDRPVSYYSLDVIISVGYRVHSQQATQFRIWATAIIREYIVKGFALDDERLKGNAGGAYWRELLERIQDIRSDERLIYRQVLDLYATSYDYDKTAASRNTKPDF